jgi:membrane dipeptidase
VIAHLEHAAEVMGAERVCLGGDFTQRLWQVLPRPALPDDGITPPGLEPGIGIEGLTGPEFYPALVAALEERGWSGSDVDAVTGGNLLGFLHNALPAGDGMPG